MPKRIGRPMVKRPPGEMVPLSTRIRGETYNKLIEAALAHGDRSLASEVEARLERSFNPILPEEDRQLMMLLGATYKHGGANAVIRVMYAMDDISAEDREILRYGMERTARQLSKTVPKSGFIDSSEQQA